MPGTMIAKRIVVVAVLVAVLALLGMLGHRLMNRSGDSMQSFGINQLGREIVIETTPAPAFELTSFNGERITLSGLRGKVVVLNFWASFCPPCLDEAPVFEQIWREYKDRDVVIVGANIWDDGQKARQFLLENELTYLNGTPGAPFAVEYGVTSIPETFVVDAQGNLTRRWNGPIKDPTELRALIDAAKKPALLAGSTKP